MNKTFLVAPLLLALLLLPGCTQNSKSIESGATQPKVFKEDPSVRLTDNLISIKDFAFDPEIFTTKAGSTVTWINDDKTLHRIVFQDLYDSGNLNNGESFTVTFDKPGTFEYFCTLHPSMKGKVVVE